jgi:hypothetical protein
MQIAQPPLTIGIHHWKSIPKRVKCCARRSKGIRSGGHRHTPRLIPQVLPVVARIQLIDRDRGAFDRQVARPRAAQDAVDLGRAAAALINYPADRVVSSATVVGPQFEAPRESGLHIRRSGSNPDNLGPAR